MKNPSLFFLLLIFIGSIFITSCTSNSNTAYSNPPADAIDTTDIEYYLAELSSDKFLGRKPCSAGEEITIDFIQKEFQKMGLEPGNGNSYFQKVPLVDITAKPSDGMYITGGKEELKFEYKKDMMTFTQQVKENIDLKDSELVFCGFGIVAPEYGWNDYDGIDMTGKTAIIFVNDPGYYSEDSTFFKGKTMTYYGRWDYKFEEAARQNADGVILIHETGAAGYPWFVVSNSWSGGLLSLQSDDDNISRCAVESWITFDAAKRLFMNSKIEAKDMLRNASQKGFKPILLGMNMSTSINNTFVKNNSNNVIAKITGSETPDEYIIYTAHWDHLGVGQVVNGDSIYNGALDNASGSASMFSIAKAYSKMMEKPKRTIIFLSVTAEEQGLLGSLWYAQNPIYPIKNTIANINMDGAAIMGRMKDLTITGYGHSEMDDIAAAEAKKQGRYILPDQEPEKGYFFRSDHFCFAKVGVPALYAKGSYDHREKGKEYAMKKKKEFTTTNYHQPSDQYLKGDWDLKGAVEDAQLFFNVGLRLANEKLYPQWKEGSEFKNARELKD